MNEFVKTLSLNFKTLLDMSSFRKTQEQIEKITDATKSVKVNVNFDEIKQKLKELEQKAATIQGTNNNFGNFISGFKSGFTEWKNGLKDFNKHGKDAFDAMKNTIKSWATDALNSIVDFAEKAIKEMKNMASWDLQNSNTYNQDAVDMYMQTGLQGAEAYGMSKALKTQNFGSMDEFIEAMPFMNQEQLDYMKEIAEISAEQYEEDLEIAQAFQEFEKEYDVFKKEMQQSFIDFFMKNKDTIMTILEGVMSILDGIMQIVGGIFELFSGPREKTEQEKKQATADILGVSSSTLNNNTTNNNTNVNVNNTFNGVGKQDQSWLANSGQMTYQQIINALK